MVVSVQKRFKRVFLFVVLAALIRFLWRKRARRTLPKSKPGVIKLYAAEHWFPWIGTVLYSKNNIHRILDVIHSNFEKAGVDHLWCGASTRPNGGSLLLRCPNCVKYIMRDNFDCFVKGPFLKNLLWDFLGDGIFNTDGEQWQRSRKTATHMFTGRRLKDHMTEVFVQTADKLIMKLEEMSSQPVDLYNMFHRLTLESFLQIGFGVELPCIVTAPKTDPFMSSFDRIQVIMQYRSVSPIWMLLRSLGLGIEAEAANKINEVDGFIDKVIQSRLESDADRPDVVSLLLKSKQESGKKPPSKKEIRDFALNFVIAGRDTTAQTLSWMFYNLDRHPRVLKKVLEEIEELAPLALSWFEKAKRMKYLHDVMSETLRLYPIVFAMSKEPLKDVVLPCGIEIKKGTHISAIPWAMGRHRKIWGDDAWLFRPERWEEEPGRPDWEFLSFNAGRRTCLGRAQAYLQVKITAAKILEKFHFRVLDSSTITYEPSLTLPMREGLPVLLTERNWAQ